MKTKTSITLSENILRGIDARSGEYKSRSEFIETAIRDYMIRLDRREAEQKDLEILNRRADALNEEAEDTLGYQAPL